MYLKLNQFAASLHTNCESRNRIYILLAKGSLYNVRENPVEKTFIVGFCDNDVITTYTDLKI